MAGQVWPAPRALPPALWLRDEEVVGRQVEDRPDQLRRFATCFPSGKGGIDGPVVTMHRPDDHGDVVRSGRCCNARSILETRRQRLLAEDRALSGLACRDHLVCMETVGAADGDDIHLWVLEHRANVR